MNDIYDYLYVFLDRVHVGCASSGFKFSIEAPAGRFPITVQRNENGEIGRATVILDRANVQESFSEELFEPLRDIWIESDVIIAGDAAKMIWERDPTRFEGSSVALDPTGANIVQIPLETEGRSAEVSWWYGGDYEAYHQGICALDIIWDSAFDPMSEDSPVRNMDALVQQFFNEHGPPSLRSESNTEES